MRATDLAPMVKAVAVVMREYVALAIGDLGTRLKALEDRPPPRDGKDGLPGPPGESTPGHQGAQGDPGPAGPEGTPGRDGRDGLPGVPGLPGEKGADGLHGKDGTDGLGFDDFEELYDGERTFTHRYRQGDRIKEFTWKIPTLIYRGVYTDGKTYEKGDVGTWAGATWHCNETTTQKPGEGSKAWTLMVKKGRDGKDGKDSSPPAVPVVKLR